MSDKKPDPAAELQAATLGMAAAVHAGAMTYWNEVVVPFSEAVTRAAVLEMDRIGKAMKEAERRRIT